MSSFDRFITRRARQIDASGIRRVFDLAANLSNPINLSIGQPDFDVPLSIKQAAIQAVEAGPNSYTVTQGIAALRERINTRICEEFPQWSEGLACGELGTLVVSGVSGGLMLAMLACIEPGDEVLIPDPYFVMYRHLVTLAGGTPVYIDTYPDFQITAERIEPYLTQHTKMLLFNTPSNPTGAVATADVCRDVAKLADDRDILLLSDEIYDEFCYEKVERGGQRRCPSPAACSKNTLILRGFSKTYGMTGWRLGYAVGPKPIIEQMTKLQQYSFVCAPSMVQHAGVAALDVDMSEHVAAYEKKRDFVVNHLHESFELTTPGGAFYAFPRVPQHLKLSDQQFVERAIEKNVLIIPGNVFSQRATHFRISYACNDDMLARGIEILNALATG